MREMPVVDEEVTKRWLWAHGQGARPEKQAILRGIAAAALGGDPTTDVNDLAIDMTMDHPDWLAVRSLTDGRFAGVMPQLDGWGRLGVNHPPGHPCADMEIFAATWDYERAIDAIAALNAWDPAVTEEPPGFSRRCGV
jgi:hypothetical protein